MDYALDPVTGDLSIVNGDVVLLAGAAAVQQHLLIRLRSVRGEWYQDRRVGVPYFEQVLDKQPNPELLRTIFARVIRETPGIRSLDSLDFELDVATRRLSLSAEATTHDDETIVIDHVELIL